MTTAALKITHAEIRRLSRCHLNQRQIKQVLLKVENDPVLWGEIKSSIEDAIESVVF